MTTRTIEGGHADTAARAAVTPRPQCTPAGRVTRSLLGYGVIAGPFYVAVSLGQAAVRDGFDLSQHEWSLLANGAGGWVQVANLLLTGLMVVAAAIGYRRSLGTSSGGRWAPRLLAAYGLGLLGAGVFRADPMNGFPAGTPDGPPVAPTLQGTLHLATAGFGFLALTAAMVVLGRHFRRSGERRRAVASVGIGVAFLAAFAGLATGASSPALNLAFTGAVLLAWAWLTSTSAHLYQQVS